MTQRQRITVMETILDYHVDRLKDLHSLLDDLDQQMDTFNQLVEYYHSDERQADIEADHAGLLSDLKRGVLSEDAVYDMLSDYYQASIKMLELTTKYLKQG